MPKINVMFISISSSSSSSNSSSSNSNNSTSSSSHRKIDSKDKTSLIVKLSQRLTGMWTRTHQTAILRLVIVIFRRRILQLIVIKFWIKVLYRKINYFNFKAMLMWMLILLTQVMVAHLNSRKIIKHLKDKVTKNSRRKHMGWRKKMMRVVVFLIVRKVNMSQIGIRRRSLKVFK